MADVTPTATPAAPAATLAPAPEATAPVVASTTPETAAAPAVAAEAKPAEQKPEAPKDRASKTVSRAIQAEREAARIKREADELRTKVEPVLGAISNKDLGKLMGVLRENGIGFDDLVKFALHDGVEPTAEEALAAKVDALQNKLSEREKAEETQRLEAQKREEADATAETMTIIAGIATKAGDKFELCTKAGEPAYTAALSLFNDAWEKAGKPAFTSQAEADDAIAAALEVVEARLEQQISPFVETSKVRSKVTPKTVEAAPSVPGAVEAAHSRRPRTITASIGSTGAAAPTTPPKRMSSRESVQYALQQLGIR